MNENIKTKENSILQCENLLNEISHLMENRQSLLKENIERLLSEAQPHLERIRRNELLTAPRFNVFSALGVVWKEVIQSRFLAYLLSPTEHHEQGGKFINAFLERIGLNVISEPNLKKVIVSPEGSADEYGRMDIVITAPDLMIVIENKIGAGEGYDQIARYQKWMGKQSASNKKLVFLTPDRRVSSTIDLKSHISPFVMSYADLAEIFLPLTDKIIPLSVRTVIDQYITACRSITFGEIAMVKRDEDLIGLLTNPQNLQAALEIEQQMSLVRTEIVKRFCENILLIINNYLEHGSITMWRATLEENRKYFSYHIVITSNYQSTYYFRANHFFNETYYGPYGWYRPSIKKEILEESEKLKQKMIIDGCIKNNKDPWWLSMKDFRQVIKYTTISNNEDIINFHDDNNSNDHPLAKKIADEIWDMFKKYRADIEALPSFKAATV